MLKLLFEYFLLFNSLNLIVRHWANNSLNWVYSANNSMIISIDIKDLEVIMAVIYGNIWLANVNQSENGSN